ncbi:hypothetical protein BJ912DRAFT_979113, partial [Pholiota molesta]
RAASDMVAAIRHRRRALAPLFSASSSMLSFVLSFALSFALTVVGAVGPGHRECEWDKRRDKRPVEITHRASYHVSSRAFYSV